MAYASSDKQGSTTSSHAQEFDLKEVITENTEQNVNNATTTVEPLGRTIRNNFRLVLPARLWPHLRWPSDHPFVMVCFVESC